jgi:long-subunit acyl-CoA synthetase (AMP-forming)
MISHRNVIANSIQICTFEATFRPDKPYTEVSLCLLPQSHIYALVYMCHAVPFRGDGVIVLPKFDIKTFLNSIQRFHINTLFLVGSEVKFLSARD